MALLDVVRAGIALAHSVTNAGNLQATVTHEAFVSQTAKGVRSYGAPVSRPALVEFKNHSVVSATGEMSVARATVTFLDASVVITDDDRITLPDGTTGPIIDRVGLVDKLTGQPVLTQIYLG